MKPWRGFAGGCVCNRPAVELMRTCGFTVDTDDAAGDSAMVAADATPELMRRCAIQVNRDGGVCASWAGFRAIFRPEFTNARISVGWREWHNPIP